MRHILLALLTGVSLAAGAPIADGTQIIPDPHGTSMNLQCSVSGGGASSGGGAMTCH